MAMNLLKKHNIQFVRTGQTMAEVIDKKIEAHSMEGSDDAFYVCDLGDVAQKYRTWSVVFPRIRPFYAVKCNDDPALLNVLALLGTGFDCASKSEIQAILKMGVSPSRIVYANPCKHSSYIRFAEKTGVDLMTFDNENELHKIKACFPNARLVLRILPPATDKVQCVLGNKFGCDVKDAPKLLQAAKDLELNVVGVSFHVGSGCYDAKAFRLAVEDARLVFDIGISLGFDFTVLDVGGGFPGTVAARITVHEIAAEMNPALDELFPPSTGVDIIAEPGRFFTASAFTLTTHVIAKRRVENPEGAGNPSFMYYVNDGVYGSFNCLLYDHADVQPSIPLSCERDSKDFNSSIWGPTCDGLDKIIEDIQLPELKEGDWIFFSDMGSYTMAAGSTFNGIPRPRVYYIAEVNLSGLSGEGISAEDQFDLHMKSGHTVCQAIVPLSLEPSVQLSSSV